MNFTDSKMSLADPSKKETKFFGTFLDLYQRNDTIDPMLKDSKFRNFIIEENGKNYQTIQMIAPSLLPIMKKPQQLLYDDEDYYIAIDTYTYTYYVCYRNLLMVDIDFYKMDEFDVKENDDANDNANAKDTTENISMQINGILDKVQEYMDLHPEEKYHFKVYQSRGGLHLFLVNRSYDYQSSEAIQLMLDLGSDFYYTVFANIRGWSVRLNKKDKDGPGDTYTYLKDIGSGYIDPHLEKLTNLHINLMKIFQNERPNLMY